MAQVVQKKQKKTIKALVIGYPKKITGKERTFAWAVTSVAELRYWIASCQLVFGTLHSPVDKKLFRYPMEQEVSLC